MTEKTNGEHPDPTCGRCGHLKSEHWALPLASPGRGDGGDVYLCPSALFLKDELQAVMDTP